MKIEVEKFTLATCFSSRFTCKGVKLTASRNNRHNKGKMTPSYQGQLTDFDKTVSFGR